MKPVEGALYMQMLAKILNMPGSTEFTMHKSVLGDQKYRGPK